MQRVLAATEVEVRASSPSAPASLRDSSLLMSLTFSSHSVSSHQGVSTIILLLSAGTKSSHLVTRLMHESRTAVARSSISCCISTSAREVFCRSVARGTFSLAPVSRRTSVTCFLARSLWPTSMRRGTPLSSQWEYFHPGVLSERSSATARMPAPASWATTPETAVWSASLVSPLTGIEMTTTCVGATRGGSTSPLSSEWIITMTPIVRVVRPQEFCQGICLFCLSSS
mmetsp:Transcript_26390/g.77502  ORF Transcript_26390/g.77502 Transcript_26390/m.77502 type:complete len:228 (+) Transcript_26390:296-979(+)